ncbi:MAG: HDIG domain-containing protein [Candidatus Omnitrophica bacterium]|nr:HDIG domain-containing protein [Candidatus Omnitrophota bacterium]
MSVFRISKSDLAAAAALFLLLLGYCAVAGLSLFIPFFLLFYAFHLKVFKRATGKRLLHLALLLSTIIFTATAMTEFSRFSPYYIPIPAVAMLTILLFNDLQLSFSMAFITSAVVALIVGAGVDFMLTFFIGGLIAAYAAKDARTRGTLLRAGLLVGLVQVAGYLLFHPYLSKLVYVHELKPLFINGLVSALAVLGALKVFEYLFGELTNFSLLELSDSINQPLLKRLAFEAPGTYHHSLILSNLAGAAADEIGANVLLVRVGAYYHDIGKLVKPHYFTENQMMADNKHDDLEPSMSRLVILNHVKEGVEIARANGMNEKIIDFIRQHHGTSLIHFFYQRALAAADGAEVVEENYRYPGPKPQTRETAIMMLSDAVEGATRSLDEHTPTKIDEVVRRVVNNKFIDGQLDECGLTLREIDAVSKSFTKVLSAMYHVRVKYPDAAQK